MESEQRDRIARALADPKRMEILRLIAGRPELSCSEVVESVDLRQPTVSHHLRELMEAGLIQSRRDGKFQRLSIDRDCFDAYLHLLRDQIL